jgi:DNA-binding NtrC family response regulator
MRPSVDLAFPIRFRIFSVVGSAAKILLIEDDPDTIRLFGEILAESGLEADGVAHDRLPEANGYGLVITDLDMRGKRYSSSDARGWVRMVADRYGVPVVVITGHSEAMLDDAMRAEVADIIEKPLDVDDLQRRVLAALSIRTH